ncbi:putative Serine/threonine-protein kinase prp4, partial [Patellaria atrata CBS 101060]
IDEDALIEERRKRRALIKAKHNAPLRVQVLQSAPNTPKSEQNASADLDTSPHVSPQTPTMDSTPHSPSVFTLEKADDFTGSNLHDINGSTEGQSAADYDPTMDMKEDHLREGHRQGDGGVPASSYDETAPEKRDILLHSSNHIRELHSNQNTDGNVNPVMEEDDDDDMFSDKFGTNAKTQEDSGVTRIPQAKELDVNLLDDWDDHEGYYRIIQGELLDGRYYVKYTLGKGVFASVVAAQNTKTGKMVAIKIVRNKETMKKAGMKEISILKLLNQADEQGKYHMVQLERSFEHKNHLCMVFQFLGENLREVVKKFGRDVGLNITAVRHYAREMFFALHLLKKCQIIHADIKPDNILSYDDHRHLKLCDLGSAAEARDSEITPYLVSRFYRAPEIILGYKYDYAIDMWAVGCTLFELYTGKILFTGNDNNQMLKAIMDCRGRFGLKFLKKCEYAAKYFDDDLSFHSTEWDNVSNRSVVRVVHIREQPLVPLKQRIMPTTKNLTPAEIKYATNFGDLLDKCLALNPEKRITPEQAFNHKFFTETFGAAKTKA